jgi:hypothetical protein
MARSARCPCSLSPLCGERDEVRGVAAGLRFAALCAAYAVRSDTLRIAARPPQPDLLPVRGEKEEELAAHAAVLWLSTGRDMNVRRAAAGKLL